jgi:dTDP-glucose 4,6-dehydratase
VEDHCKAIDMIVRNGKDGEIYNVGGHNEKQNIEIVKLTIATIHQIMTEQPEYRSILKKKEMTPDGQISIDWINDSLITFVKDRLGHTSVMPSIRLKLPANSDGLQRLNLKMVS